MTFPDFATFTQSPFHFNKSVRDLTLNISVREEKRKFFYHMLKKKKRKVN